jgi:hypothetical protein
MNGEKEWYYRSEDGNVYGPADPGSLNSWARDGRIQPTGFISKDRISWSPVQLMPELEMKWLVEVEPGKVFGPFHRDYVVQLDKNGSLGQGAKFYRFHEFSVDRDPPPVVVEKIVEKEVIREVPVEKIVEKEVIREVPVEKIVEKIVEVEPPARTTLVVPDVVEPVNVQPPAGDVGGIFKGANLQQLAALEAEAKRELSAAKKFGFGIRFGGAK